MVLLPHMPVNLFVAFDGLESLVLSKMQRNRDVARKRHLRESFGNRISRAPWYRVTSVHY